MKITFADGGNVQANISDGGYEEGRAWVDFTGDGRADYLRVVAPRNGGMGEVIVSPANATGTNLAADIRIREDIGHPVGRTWIDVNRDGKADFVRFVGSDVGDRIKVSYSDGQGFMHSDFFPLRD